jgi:hypothetical protein
MRSGRVSTFLALRRSDVAGRAVFFFSITLLFLLSSKLESFLFATDAAAK